MTDVHCRTGSSTNSGGDLPILICAALKRFADEPSLDIKGLVAIDLLASWDASAILMLEWSDSYSIICQKMKVSMDPALAIHHTFSIIVL